MPCWSVCYVLHEIMWEWAIRVVLLHSSGCLSLMLDRKNTGLGLLMVQFWLLDLSFMQRPLYVRFLIVPTPGYSTPKRLRLLQASFFLNPKASIWDGCLPFLLYLRKQSRSNHTCYLRELCHGRGIFKLIFPFLQSMWLFCILLGCLCYTTWVIADCS